jgi:hypothetical protein
MLLRLLQLRTDITPELTSKAATRHYMTPRLQRRRTDGAAALTGGDNIFAKEVVAALDTILDGEPPEELDL